MASSELAGGFKLGDAVYFSGESEQCKYFDPDEAHMYGNPADSWEYGAKGEVTGPCTFKPDEGVMVSFTDNKEPIRCWLDALSREPPPPKVKGGCGCVVQ
jgi:hypothetical protein